MTIIATGIDLAKSVFAMHGVGAGGAAQLRQPKVARGKLNALVASMPPRPGLSSLRGQKYCAGV